MTIRFLVVEDSTTMRKIVVHALERLGHTEVVEATDGLEALERLDSSIGFIITDWNMPGMGGVAFARAVRARPAEKGGGAAIPILMVTTRAAREDIIAAIDAGISNYILKPITLTVLKDKIDRLLMGAVTEN